MTTIMLTLPDDLAQEATLAGLLTPPRLEQWVREQLKQQRIDQLFAAMDRMQAITEPEPLTPEEMAREIFAMRCERRVRSNP